MKRTVITALFLSNFLIAFGQAKVCETSKEDTLDQNVITLNKCTIKEDALKQNKIERKRIIRKRISKSKSNLLTVKSKSINFEVNDNTEEKIKLTQKVLFDLVENIPMFDSCEKLTKEENVKCFKTTIAKHFNENFPIDKFSDERKKDRVFIQFNIGINGIVTDVKIKTSNEILKKELYKVINKLPVFSPGYEKGIPVIVSYSFPFNLTLT